MDAYPSANEIITPLIVAGTARSGTRFVTNALNLIPGVTIHGEIPPSVMRRAVEVYDQGDLVYQQQQPIRDHISKKWQQSKASYLFACWTYLSKGNARYYSGGKYFGYKSPYHEFFHDFYCKAFAPDVPKYICCIRSFPQHLLSVQARWPQRAIINVARRYSSSLRQIQRIKERSAEHVLLFCLDDYIAIGPRYLEEQIFTPLGLEDTEKALQYSAKGAANSSASLGVKKKAALSHFQRLYLWFDRTPERLFRRLRSGYGDRLITQHHSRGTQIDA